MFFCEQCNKAIQMDCHHSDPRIKKPVLNCEWIYHIAILKTGIETWKCKYCNDSIFIGIDDSFDANEDETLTKPCPKRN